MKNEFEIRGKLLNINSVLKFFNKNAQKLKEVHQVDTYFDNKHSSFITDINHINNWLRIREEDNIITLNYKHWLPEGAEIKTYCRENELTIQSKEEMTDILIGLGFHQLVEVDKFRRSFKYKDCEISIDRVKNLGEYIEIEYYGDLNNPKTINNYLQSILNDINAEIRELDHKGYAYHLIHLKLNHAN